MDRKRARELLPIIQAYAEGKTIQWRSSNSPTCVWSEGADNLQFFNTYEYRIKPELMTGYVHICDFHTGCHGRDDCIKVKQVEE